MPAPPSGAGPLPAVPDLRAPAQPGCPGARAGLCGGMEGARQWTIAEAPCPG